MIIIHCHKNECGETIFGTQMCFYSFGSIDNLRTHGEEVVKNIEIHPPRNLKTNVPAITYSSCLIIKTCINL